ncbi:Transcription termination/antitermination protein NusA [Anaerolineae bacterium]|nr:Transcription termination/antitermination protein NusA [Anaerolineae bacterium]
MKNDFLVAITQLCSERSLPKEIVIQAVEQALVSAYKRNFGGGQNISAVIDPATGKVKIFAHKVIVDEVHDQRAEITLAEAKLHDPMAQVGGTVQIEATPDDFGRIAAQTAKQVILQRIREAERDALYTKFAGREGEIVLGVVHNVDSQNITVMLDKIEAILPRAEQIPTERYRHNQKIRAYISEVNKTSRGPQVILSRTHLNMIRRLFELEVPEIFNGLVEIKSIAREAGSRSKIGVSARQDGIDPVGACVGQRGVRIQAVVNELNGEKIDVVEWSPDAAKFVANSLSPAKAVGVRLSEDANGDKVANVVVGDNQLSLAIGKEGQNARLAAKLTGWRIDIKSETQVAEEIARRATAEAERVAALSSEDIAAEKAAAQALLEALAEPIEEPVAETPEAELAAAETPVELVAEVEATSEPSVEPVEIAETLAEQPDVAQVEGEPQAVATTEVEDFGQALEAFEAEEGEDESPEDALKRKAGKKKGQTLVFDESLGKVVVKRKRKGGRARDEWSEEIE